VTSFHFPARRLDNLAIVSARHTITQRHQQRTGTRCALAAPPSENAEKSSTRCAESAVYNSADHEFHYTLNQDKPR
jgi:hypothetical protein